LNLGNSLKLVLAAVTVIALAVGLANPIKNSINLGPDLKGGVRVLLEVVDSPDNPVTPEAMNKVKDIIEYRVSQSGVSEPTIQLEGSRWLVVELAGAEDTRKALDLIGRTALLEFKTDDGKTVLTGKALQDARAAMNQAGQPEIQLEFTSAGSKTFGKVTAANVGRKIAIYLDNELVTDPVVDGPITTGRGVLHGGYQTLADAEKHAILLRSGALPAAVKILEQRSVGPSLGADSLTKSFYAGIVGIAAIFIFMLAYYRLPGLIANLSLILDAVLILGIFALWSKYPLNLPGIAGFILSLGMAVDANVLIYERLKEELKAGKPLMAAIDAGFKRAFTTIFDANLTTMIAAAVLLFVFGASPIRGFAVTLIIGNLVSMFTAMTFTRLVLRLTAKSNLVTSRKFYGA
jgi:preprotein translocase subunit SecD